MRRHRLVIDPVKPEQSEKPTPSAYEIIRQIHRQVMCETTKAPKTQAAPIEIRCDAASRSAGTGKPAGCQFLQETCEGGGNRPHSEAEVHVDALLGGRAAQAPAPLPGILPVRFPSPAGAARTPPGPAFPDRATPFRPFRARAQDERSLRCLRAPRCGSPVTASSRSLSACASSVTNSARSRARLIST